MAIAIKVENLSKAYQLGEIGTGTLSRDLERWFAKVRGKEDPFLKIGETNDRTSKSTSNIVWSLKDINFEIQQGDAVGIIGRNGAGKSTLLKLLSRVTSPTTGNIKVKGRIASLLEVGTGFHPELTGKENIYLNGAILGMRKKEIIRKFDEIVDFAGVERYIDTPVKRYSSGMYVRLAFAVAAHLESEILIVDEVLAVGDAEFQKKCLGKMNEVSKGEGRTVLFVSHNMQAVQKLCSQIIILSLGKNLFHGSMQEGINTYLKETNFKADSNGNFKFNSDIEQNKTKTIGYSTMILKRFDGTESAVFKYKEPFKIEFTFYSKQIYHKAIIGFAILTQEGVVIYTSHWDDLSNNKTIAVGENAATCIINPNILLPGRYIIQLGIVDSFGQGLESITEAGFFDIEKILHDENSILDYRPGLIYNTYTWE